MKTISEEYKNILEWEHRTTPGLWGHSANQIFETILTYARSVNLTEILDYGAGHGGFGIAVREKYSSESYTIYEYEPSRPDHIQPPEPRDFVICIDVLEHIEPEFLENVLNELQRVTRQYGYFTISCRKANKMIKDGQNAHLIVQPPDWWKSKIENRFKIVEESYDTHDKNYKIFVKKL
jgi:hypothetical protein